jgi:hypothetical protein
MKTTKILLPAFLLCQTGIIVIGQTNDPIVVTSRTILTNNATHFKDRSRVPSLLGGDEEESPVAATNFLALDGVEDYVPDTHGAVGQDYVMTMLNTKVSVQTKGGLSRV